MEYKVFVEWGTNPLSTFDLGVRFDKYKGGFWFLVGLGWPYFTFQVREK